MRTDRPGLLLEQFGQAREMPGEGVPHAGAGPVHHAGAGMPSPRA
ncbi:hypothetical protein [Streptomyces sp. NPDC060322]